VFSKRWWRTQRLIILSILTANFPHDFGKPLVFPRSISAYQIPIEPLPAYTQHFAAKCNSSFPLAVFYFYGDEFHSLPFADFRRLAAKKALVSARNSFSSFSRRISFSCCFTCLRRVFNSSARLIAVCGVCAPPPMPKRPSLAALTHPYSVSTGIPNSTAAFEDPISFDSFTACTLYSVLYLQRCTKGT